MSGTTLGRLQVTLSNLCTPPMMKIFTFAIDEETETHTGNSVKVTQLIRRKSRG